MLTQATHLLIVTAEVDPQVEAEWNRWYDTVHLPEALACPGVLSGRRFMSVGDTRQSDRGVAGWSSARVYTTIYELSGPEAVDTAAFNKMRGWYQFAPHVRAATRVVAALKPIKA
jgi:hypothetical protein